MHKKAQAWGFDLIIGSVIFTLGIAMFYFYTINISQESDSILNQMNYEAYKISSKK